MDQGETRQENVQVEALPPPPLLLEFMTPPLFTHPLSIFVLAHWLLDSSHNLRMIHEGRTIVTILV